MNSIIELISVLSNFLGSGQAMKILTIIIDAVRAAEDAYQGAKKGALKKDAVMQVVSDAVDTIDVFKDGTAEYKAMIMGVISNIIDAIVSAFNFSGMWGRKVNITWEGGKLE